MKFLQLLSSILCVMVAYAHKNEAHNKSVHLDCFDVFIPLVDRVSNEAKEASGNCVTTATAEKDREMVAIKNTRSELISEVKRIKETLAHCSSQADHLGYFECLNGIIEVDKKIVGDITLKSSVYSNKIGTIEKQELECFRNSILKMKDKITNSIKNLHYCLFSEDDVSPTSGEKSKHNELNHSSSHRHPAGIQSTTHFPQTTSYPEYRYDDYDENINNF